MGNPSDTLSHRGKEAPFKDVYRCVYVINSYTFTEKQTPFKRTMAVHNPISIYQTRYRSLNSFQCWIVIEGLATASNGHLTFAKKLRSNTPNATLYLNVISQLLWGIKTRVVVLHNTLRSLIPDSLYKKHIKVFDIP